ncbi:MAG: DUF1080 domain-containing protein [Gemmatimonadetes bacterium]|nr:DUF1080 domain-containing protein [Gemmatimonadota bacterium]
MRRPGARPWIGMLRPLACAVFVAACASPDSEADDPPGSSHDVLSERERADGWRLLFDGATTTGWRSYNGAAFPDTGWAVVDGMLVVGATATDPDVPIGGDIVTEETFTDFDLRFEFRLSPVANSGVLYRVLEEPGAAIWHNAPEFQVLDDQAYIDMGTMDMRTHLSGDNYDLHESTERALRPLGEWNEGRVVVRGAQVEHWLNGVRTVAYELWSPDWEARVAASKFAPFERYGRATSGPIGLQDHGRLVWYRDIKIRPLDETQGLFNGVDLDGWQVHGTERWYVEDGELVCESGPDEAYGYLATERTFGDFDLELEFKQEADGNSGVFFRSSLEDTRISGWQAEVAPPGLHTGGIYESYGRGWLIRPDASSPDVAMGEWNRLRVRVVGDTVRTWLNGAQKVELVDAEVGGARGSIALQIHDGGGIKVRWRNLRLRDLDD